MGRKHCRKRRNCSLPAISPFPTVFFKRLVSQGRQKVSLCGNGLNHAFNLEKPKRLRIYNTQNSPYEELNVRLPSSHDALKVLDLFPYNTKFIFPKQALVFTCLQYKSFENTADKGETARNKQFLLYPQCFLPVSKTCCHFH